MADYRSAQGLMLVYAAVSYDFVNPLSASTPLSLAVRIKNHRCRALIGALDPPLDNSTRRACETIPLLDTSKWSVNFESLAAALRLNGGMVSSVAEVETHYLCIAHVTVYILL